ncbi:hypothetical protein pb186bvf_017853 [Paramecium bursaria]
MNQKIQSFIEQNVPHTPFDPPYLGFDEDEFHEYLVQQRLLAQQLKDTDQMIKSILIWCKHDYCKLESSEQQVKQLLMLLSHNFLKTNPQVSDKLNQFIKDNYGVEEFNSQHSLTISSDSPKVLKYEDKKIWSTFIDFLNCKDKKNK